ncbi:MAG: hypothetical protein U5L72_17850 [Bacteroidales bacterium]|nr:hypothetical protein [Bacteroidales bacterium]
MVAAFQGSIHPIHLGDNPVFGIKNGKIRKTGSTYGIHPFILDASGNQNINVIFLTLNIFFISALFL